MVYHVYNSSIADFVIFNNDYEFSRMLMAIRYYQIGASAVNFAHFMNRKKIKREHDIGKDMRPGKKEKLVEILAYCLMPTHLHLLLEELKEDGIRKFISLILNSYTRYFNIKYHRKGPLWAGRSKKVQIETDEQLIHTTRYIHLNPVTAYIVDKPEKWPYSSYMEYVSEIRESKRICRFEHLLRIKPYEYRQFVESGVVYQRDLAVMKKVEID